MSAGGRFSEGSKRPPPSPAPTKSATGYSQPQMALLTPEHQPDNTLCTRNIFDRINKITYTEAKIRYQKTKLFEANYHAKKNSNVRNCFEGLTSIAKLKMIA